MKTLLEFYNDSETRENVKLFITQILEREAIKRVFAREKTEYIADAKEVLDLAFEEMGNLFKEKAKKREAEPPR